MFKIICLLKTWSHQLAGSVNYLKYVDPSRTKHFYSVGVVALMRVSMSRSWVRIHLRKMTRTKLMERRTFCWMFLPINFVFLKNCVTSFDWPIVVSMFHQSCYCATHGAIVLVSCSILVCNGSSSLYRSHMLGLTVYISFKLPVKKHIVHPLAKKIRLYLNTVLRMFLKEG